MIDLVGSVPRAPTCGCAQLGKAERQVAAARKEAGAANEDVGRLTQEKRALFVRLKQTESRLNKMMDEAGGWVGGLTL